MKKNIVSLLLTTTSILAQGQIVDIPDANFKLALISLGVDKNNDNEIQISEAAFVTSLQVPHKFISDLTGIQAFTSLTYFACQENQLTTLDVSQNTSLTNLYCGSNLLTTLDVSKNTALTSLICSANQLSSLDVTKNTALVNLYCTENKLTAIDLSQNVALSQLWLTSNRLTKLDVSQNHSLTWLLCDNNLLTSLDVSNNTGLKDTVVYNYPGLECGNNPNLTQICINISQIDSSKSWKKDASAIFSTTCVTTGIIENGLLHANKELVRIYNNLGQAIKPEEVVVGTLYIYQYSDGSKRKVINQE